VVLEMNLGALTFLAIVKGVVGATIYIIIAHGIKKPLAGALVFLLFTGLPWLGLVYSEGPLLEKIQDLGILFFDGIIGLISGGIAIFFYELFTGGFRREGYG